MTDDEIISAINESVCTINELSSVLAERWEGKVICAYGGRNMRVTGSEVDLNYPGRAVRLRGDILNKNGEPSKLHAPYSVLFADVELV